MAVPLVQQGYDVTVVGSSEVCRRRLDLILKQGSFQYHSCNMLSLPFENESYDVVLTFRLLPHVNEWRRLLAEMCRVAKNDVIVDYPDVISFNVIANQFFKTKKAIEGNTRPYRCFRRSELLKEFAEHRFRQSAIRPEFFIPMVIHRALGSVKISKTIEFFSNMLGMRRLFGSPVILRVSRANHGC